MTVELEKTSVSLRVPAEICDAFDRAASVLVMHEIVTIIDRADLKNAPRQVR